MNINLLLDSFVSLLNRLLTIFKLTLKNNIVGVGLLSDDLLKMDNFLNMIRGPFIDSSFANIIAAEYNKNTSSINTIILFGSIVFATIHVCSTVFYKYIFKILYIQNNLMNKNIFYILLHTIWMLFIYSTTNTIISRNTKYRKYATISLFVGNICFVAVLLLSFIGFQSIYLWIIGNVLYGFIPMLICLYLFCTKIFIDMNLSKISFSFFIGIVNIYWPKISEFVLNSLLYKKMKSGNLTEINFGYKISEIITQSLTKPLLRNIISVYKSTGNINETYIQCHSILIFPILFIIMIIFYMSDLYLFNKFQNKNILILSIVFNLICTYFASINSVLKSILIFNEHNHINFHSLNINIITKTIFILIGLYASIQSFNIMFYSVIVANICEFIYLHYFIFRNMNIELNIKKYIYNTTVSCIISFVGYLIIRFIIHKFIAKLVSVLFGICAYIVYLIYFI